MASLHPTEMGQLCHHDHMVLPVLLLLLPSLMSWTSTDTGEAFFFFVYNPGLSLCFFFLIFYFVLEYS